MSRARRLFGGAAWAGALLLCVLLAIGAAAARASPEARFHDATALIGEKRYEEAAEAMLSFAAEDPDHRLADEALFSAAELYEERLAAPARAAELYRRLRAEHPESRRALAAKRRLGRLETALGPEGRGSEPLARFTEIKQRFPEREEASSIAKAEALLREHPGWAGAPRVALWLAEVHERGGRLARAARRYEEVLERWPKSPEVLSARTGAGHVALARGRLDEAERHFSALPADDPGQRRAREDALARLERAHFRALLHPLAMAALFLAVLLLGASLYRGAGSLPASARLLARPPTEVIYMLPPAALFCAAAFTDFLGAAPAVVLITAGGIALAWLSGAGLRAAEVTWRRVLLHAGACMVGVVALCYIALYRLRLLDLVVATLRYGPDA